MQRHGKSLGFTLTCTFRPASEQPNSAMSPERRVGGLGLCLLQGTSGSTWDLGCHTLRQKHTDTHTGHRDTQGHTVMGHTDTQGHTDTLRDRQTNTRRHIDTHTGTYRHRDTQTLRDTQTYTRGHPTHTSVTQTHTGPSSDSPVLSTAMLWSP